MKKHGAVRPVPFRRMESPPGFEAQVDFGSGGPVIGRDGRRRKTHVLRVVLPHSRRGYSEVVFTQSTDDFIQCLENAFEHFGGVPHTLVIDNLKAGVLKADWFDPELNPKLEDFCRHYGTTVLPTKPRTPRHKGKVERGIDYVQENALKGRKFTSLAEQNEFLQGWERGTADTWIHGTTKKQVLVLFNEAERAALLPLPPVRFENFHEARRKVSRDGHVEVAKAFYSVPPEYLGREVWVRWNGRSVRVFNDRMQQIAIHSKKKVTATKSGELEWLPIFGDRHLFLWPGPVIRRRARERDHAGVSERSRRSDGGRLQQRRRPAVVGVRPDVTVVVERMSGFWGAWATVAEITPAVSSYDDYGLEPSTAYAYRIAFRNAHGSSEFSGIVSAVTPAGPRVSAAYRTPSVVFVG